MSKKWTFDFTALTNVLEKHDLKPLDWAIEEKPKPIPSSPSGFIVIDDNEHEVHQGKGKNGQLIDAKGVSYCVYIKDLSFGSSLNDALQEDLSPKKVHFMHDCQTLNTMAKGGRYERYHAIYEHNLSERNRLAVIGSQKKLDHYICKNCLKLDKSSSNQTRTTDIFNTSQSTNKQAFLNDGDTPEKLEKLAKTLLIADILKVYNGPNPKRPTTGLGNGEYSQDWPRISEHTRAKKNWTCEGCAVDLTKDHGLLDVHHVNGVKSDNSETNLRVLCKLCHSQQPSHGHYKVKNEDKAIIENLQREQKCNN